MTEDDDFIAKLTAFDEALDDLTPIALGRGIEHIRAVSAELVPVQSSHLVGSADVTVHGDMAQIKYPGPYSRAQHYRLDYRHTHGQALYLEQPLRTEAQKVLEIVADTLKEAH